jgi:hypothetical protein
MFALYDGGESRALVRLSFLVRVIRVRGSRFSEEAFEFEGGLCGFRQRRLQNVALYLPAPAIVGFFVIIIIEPG